MTRSRFLALSATTASVALLSAVALVPAAGAAPNPVQNCHSVALSRPGHVELRLSTNTTGVKSAQADVRTLSALQVCYSLTAEAGADATSAPPVVTVTPTAPNPNDTTACAQIDVAIQAVGTVRGQVTATVAAAAAPSATGAPPAAAGTGTTLSKDISVTPPAVGEHVTAKACISTSGDVAVS